uniref:gastrin/cholecystokinin-like peptide n=1 Tax=Euleptes europaea TaxID=460621 RepID=UPI0025411821|nr:gastrin/cholecystokinin-like peptide [Euleptes europaea]
MHPKMFACLLLATLVATGLSGSMPTSRQVDSRTNYHRTAEPEPERTQRLIRRQWPEGLSLDQKHLISQFLPHIYAAELSGKENSVQMDDGFRSHNDPSWLDFGRRSLKDVNEDA